MTAHLIADLRLIAAWNKDGGPTPVTKCPDKYRICAAAAAALEAVESVLPGSYYMDPPDGGSVEVLEQLQRMAQDAAKWREQQARISLAIACEKACEG